MVICLLASLSLSLSLNLVSKSSAFFAVFNVSKTRWQQVAATNERAKRQIIPTCGRPTTNCNGRAVGSSCEPSAKPPIMVIILLLLLLFLLESGLKHRVMPTYDEGQVRAKTGDAWAHWFFCYRGDVLHVCAMCSGNR